MKGNKSARLSRIDENHFFYICLILVLATAAIGLLIDIAGRR